MKRLQSVAWVLILIVDVGYIAWGGAAAAAPVRLLGPGGVAILPAGYQGYSGASWSQLAGASPVAAGYMTLLFRMYGTYNVLFGLLGSSIAVTASWLAMIRIGPTGESIEVHMSFLLLRRPYGGCRGQ